MTKKRFFAQTKNSKISASDFVFYAGIFCVFDAKKSRVIFYTGFPPFRNIYWTFRSRGCPLSRF